MSSHKRLTGLMIAVAAGWMAVMAGSLGWNLFNEERQRIEQARRAALVSLDKDTAFRQWVRSHGGVYVPIDERTPPNPGIAHVPNRDVIIGGKPHTLMNSSYATRQMMEEAGGKTGLFSRVTSLNPLRPQNAPDAWEEKTLRAVEQSGSREDVFEVIGLNGDRQLRGLRPFYVEESCLKCHAKQGYKVGDLRGGITVRIDLGRFFFQGGSIEKTLILTHGMMALLGLLGIGWLHKEAARNLRNKEALTRMNRSLEERVLEEIEKRREQEQMLIQQSKMASMGEMIGAIAHQWRQPLNSLGITIQDLLDAHRYGELSEIYLEENVKRAMRQIEFMSHTIDDFRNFFRPDTNHTSFDVTRSVQEVAALLSAQLKSHHIALKLSLPEEPVNVRGYANQFKQALLNILSNAKDAIVAGSVAAGEIEVILKSRSEGHCYLEVCDNAGGIPETIIEKIFDPYFTTKEAGKGTGIGLYMARSIIEENMNGTLRAENRGGGACFVLEVGL